MTTQNDNPELPVWQAPPATGVDASTGGADAIPGEPATGPTEAAAGLAAGESVPGPRYVPSRKRRLNSTGVLLVVAGLVAVGGVGFAIGHVTGNTSMTGTTTGANGNGLPGDGQFGPNASGNPVRPDGSGDPGNFGGRGGAATSSLVTGTVTAISSDSMTIQLANGQTVTVALGSSTTWHSQTSSSSSSVSAGSTVIVQTATGTSATASTAPGASAGTGTRTATDVTVTSGN